MAAVLFLWASGAHSATVTVNSTADNVVTDGACTLREAITSMNNGSSLPDCQSVGAWGTNDTIAFNIPGNGVHVIAPQNVLPALTRVGTVVNGYSQPGSSPNTIAAGNYPNATALNTVIRVELDGGPTALAYGLSIDASNVTVRGLSLVNFGAMGGINVDGNAAQISGNFLGWRADGVTRAVNYYGVRMLGSINSSVGSGDAKDRNLLASTSTDVYAADSDGVSVLGNLMGVNINGSGAGGVSPGTGISLQHVAIANIGTNVIANREGDGIFLQNTHDAVIGGNSIGEGVGGAPLSIRRGIVMFTSPSVAGYSGNNLIKANGIAASTEDGIVLYGYGIPLDAQGNRLDNNVIYGNTGLGINLQPDGEAANLVTPNDAGDADIGPNLQQNFPVTISALINKDGSITVAFTLDSTPSGNFEVSAYANPACHKSGYGEGRYASGQANLAVSADASGHATGQIQIPTPWPTGWKEGAAVSLLASDTATNNTSEFSACSQLKLAVGTPPNLSHVPEQILLVGDSLDLDLIPFIHPTEDDLVVAMDTVSGSLPPGLAFVSGRITGKTTQAGLFSIQWRVLDVDGWSAIDTVLFQVKAVEDGGGPGRGEEGNGGENGPGGVNASAPVAVDAMSSEGLIAIMLLMLCVACLQLAKGARD